MSGGRFLASLREVQSSDKILRIKALLKADIQSWNNEVKCGHFKGFENEENSLCKDSREVAIHIAGYNTKEMFDKSKCSPTEC